MKSIKFALAAIASSALFAGAAQAQGLFEPAEGNWYVSAFGGVSFLNDDVDDLDLDPLGIESDTGFFVGASAGGRLPFKSFGLIRTRVEVEVSYQDNGLSFVGGGDTNLSIDTLFILGNTIGELHWADDQPFIPYIGGGLGVGIIGVTDTALDISESETNFATTNTLGVTVPAGQLEFFGEGRYYRIWNVGEDDIADGVNVDGFAFTAGARLVF